MRQNTFIISEHLQKQPQATASQSITGGCRPERYTNG
jgi:hypothetical protein